MVVVPYARHLLRRIYGLSFLSRNTSYGSWDLIVEKQFKFVVAFRILLDTETKAYRGGLVPVVFASDVLINFGPVCEGLQRIVTQSLQLNNLCFVKHFYH